jgi:hypothetical protein
MASRRNRNRTQRKNKNKNKSRRNRKHRGGAMSIGCNAAQRIVNDPSSKRVEKMAAQVQLKSCSTGMKSIAPNMKWANTRVRAGIYEKCNSGYSPNGKSCLDGSMPRLPNDFEEASSPRAY